MEILAKYVYKVYEEQSITKAANKLFISQPALSAAVARHEKELGFRIFDRTTMPISLTPEGQIYIDSLTDILTIEDDRKRKIEAQSMIYPQEVVIGGSSTIAYYLLPQICAEFQIKNPHIQIKIDLGNVGDRNNLIEKLRNEKIDLLLEYVLPPFDCHYTLLFEDELVIAVPNSLPISDSLSQHAISYEELIAKNADPTKRISDTSIFQNIPFPNYNNAGELLFNKARELLGDFSTSVLRVTNSKNSIINHYLARYGCYAVLTTVNTTKHLFTPNDDLSYFLLSNDTAKRSIYLCTTTRKFNTPAINAFIKTAHSVCANGNP